MPEEGFFRRWARLKSTGPAEAAGIQAAPAVAAPPPAIPVADAGRLDAGTQPQAPLPTLADAEQLTPDADFSAFVAKGVDKSVQRLALKKLFADPHFNAMDGLDMYMGDYNLPSPLTPAMLASLKHAQGLVTRLLDDQQKAADEQDGANGEPCAIEQAATMEQVDVHEQSGTNEPVDTNEQAAHLAVQAPRSTPQGNA